MSECKRGECEFEYETECINCGRDGEKYIAELEAKLVEIANIAHHGGLTGHDSNDIRRLTLPFWDMAECARLQEQGE